MTKSVMPSAKATSVCGEVNSRSPVSWLTILTVTVVIGSNVRVSPAAVAHGSLVVRITETALVSQPNEFAGGSTVVVGQSDIEVDEGDGRMFLFEPGTSLNDIVEAVNQVGAAPGDLVAILEALRESGALRAQLLTAVTGIDHHGAKARRRPLRGNHQPRVRRRRWRHRNGGGLGGGVHGSIVRH